MGGQWELGVLGKGTPSEGRGEGEGGEKARLLPPWHIYECSTSYYILSHACTQVRGGLGIVCGEAVGKK